MSHMRSVRYPALDDLGFPHLAEESQVTKEKMFPLPGGMLAIAMACRKQTKEAKRSFVSKMLKEVVDQNARPFAV
jgi:hypothetical protein